MYLPRYADISKERLGEMGVKTGHQIKIIKKVKE
jgi:Fe2+ transport system protein FeoA